MRYNSKSIQGVVARTIFCTVTDSVGDLNVFNVEHDDDERWLNGNNGNPDNVWFSDNRWVFLRSKSSYFSPDLLLGEFCFVSCPFHPPSILPISSIFTDRAIYFLLTRDAVLSWQGPTLTVGLFQMNQGCADRFHGVGFAC